ncbi:MAG: hypothetical protein GY795_31545 [Desulfobacterales bacterium]|nr:hypothetical protein [Desulfobacterales bacterium]
MNPILEPIIKNVRQLPLPYQLELVSEITRSLSMKYGTPDYGTDFWNPKPLDEIIETSPAGPISDIEALAGNFWPDEESVDDFNRYIYSQHRED